MIIGEAPGRREDDSGRPFVGRSGAMLERILEDNGWYREDVFITNAVSCRPPNNRTPSKKEIAACKKWLDYQIAMVKPKYILTLGNVPIVSLTGKTGVKKLRGKPIEKDGMVIMPTLHPAAALYDPKMAYYIEKDVSKFRDIVDFGGIPREREVDVITVDTMAKVDEMLRAMIGVVSHDIEATGLYPWAADAAVASIGFGTKHNQWCIPVNHCDIKAPFTDSQLIDILERVAERLDECIVVGHNMKFDVQWLWLHYGIRLSHDFDTMLAHYLCDENARHGLDELSTRYLGAPDYDIPLPEKQGKVGTWEKHSDYLGHDLYYTRKLYYLLKRRLQEDTEIKRVFDKLLMPAARMFTEIEMDGVYIDTSKFDEAEEYLRGEKAAAEEDLKKYGNINWGSPKQVGELLYGKLGIPVIVRTKKGSPSTSESALNQMDHPARHAIIRLRGANQQLSFFIEGWKPFLDGNILHPSFKLHGTVTGRPSCEHPNLQQVPRDPRIRQLVSAGPGWTLVEVDLSQIELRLAAELAGERTMLEAFRTGVDAHWLTMIREIGRSGAQKEIVLDTARTLMQDKTIQYSAALDIILKAGPDRCTEVRSEWAELRKKAKAINFGYLYGMWWKKFKIYARDNYGVEVTDQEAQGSRVSFFDLYKDFTPWHERQRKFARYDGYVRSMAGRKRRLPKAMSSRPEDKFDRMEAERQAINSPVQSFASDINLMSALQLREEFPRSQLRICGTVHDAILLVVKNEYIEQVTSRALEIMKRPKLFDDFGINLKVPLEAEAKVGPWSKGVKFEKWLKTRAETKTVTSRSASPRSRGTATAATPTTSSMWRASARNARPGRFNSAR
jgi:DNA polymerase-1